MTPLLYHYTCDRGDRGIRADRALRGNPHPLMPGVGPLIWLTDLETPDALALGLTSFSLSCDRTAHRFAVRTRRAQHWPRVVRTLCSPSTRRRLDWAPGAMPMHWWVAVAELVPLTGEAGGA